MKLSALTRRFQPDTTGIFIFVLVLFVLACGGISTSPSALTSHPILPSLTPTSLSTLTPTVVITPGSTENVPDSPVPDSPVLSDVATGIPNDTPPPVPVSNAEEASPSVVPVEKPSPATSQFPASPPTETASSPPQAATATPAPPEPTSTPSPPVDPDPVPEMVYDGWAFFNLGISTSSEGLVIYGELVNNTGVTQQLDLLSGLFYDSHGNVIADDRAMETRWSVDVVSPGDEVPFELLVAGIGTPANYELVVEAQPLSP